MSSSSSPQETSRINPLSRRPSERRLVMAVRGAAGTGKSVFAASMADAVDGRLCFFDTERKARLLEGADGSKFDAIEVKAPSELPEFIDWALDGAGRERGYECFALDSWAMYFGRKHRDTLKAVRSREGSGPTAQPDADELQADQMIYQEVLRRLCVDSGKHVVITDQIAAKGKEKEEENQMGRVLPMTTGGLEYFVDLMVELEVRQSDFEQVHVARVVKSNTPDFEVGREVGPNPRFGDFLELMSDGPSGAPSENVPETLPERDPDPPSGRGGGSPEEEEAGKARSNGQTAGQSLEDLRENASEHGISEAQLVNAARHYMGKSNLKALTGEEIERLSRRMSDHYDD